MRDQPSQSTPPREEQGSAAVQPPPKKKLDVLVKLALGVLFTAFALIWGGMFLSRPDRSIPPYSIGSQEETAVAIHVPGWTSDPEIETLIERFRKVGRETHDFGKMKVRPTTPDDPAGRYRRITMYIFTHDSWAEPEILHKYLAGEDRALHEAFENAVRGLYRLEGDEEEGRIGPSLTGKDTAATAAYSRVLFKGSITKAPAGPEPQ
ncbi:MAG: hypothetical protein ACKOCD_06580 [Nitrospiraceae bacterium]